MSFSYYILRINTNIVIIKNLVPPRHRKEAACCEPVETYQTCARNVGGYWSQRTDRRGRGNATQIYSSATAAHE